MQPTRLLCPWDSPGKNTGVGCYFLLQGVFMTQGWNPGFSHCRQILYCLSHQGSPRILKWVAYSFSGGSSQPTIKPESPALQADSLPAELPGKPKNIQSTEFSRPEYCTGQPFPSLGIFPTQGSNPGLLHCRQILYQLSHQGSPETCLLHSNFQFERESSKK